MDKKNWLMVRKRSGQTCKDRRVVEQEQQNETIEEKRKVREHEAINGRMMDIFHHRSQDRSVCDIC